MSSFMNVLLDMSLVGTYCILIVLVLRLLLRKAPRIFSYLLWGVVFLRLAVPIFPEAPVSLVPPAIRSFSVTSYFVASENTGLTDLVTTDIDAGSEVSPEVVKNSPELVQVVPANQDPASAPSNWVDLIATSFPSRDFVGQGIFVVWCTGIVLLATYNLIAYLRLRRRLTDAVREDGTFVSDKISSPFVLGLLHPRIYLPVGLSPEERSFVILHERAHLLRWDPVIKLLAFLITCLHWFNPFAWIAFLLFSRDIETTCDESVIQNLTDSSRKEYSATLVSVASRRNILRPMPLAFGEGDLKGRIRGILNYKKPAIWLISLAVVSIVVICIGLLINPLGSGSEETSDKDAKFTRYAANFRPNYDPTDIPVKYGSSVEDFLEEADTRRSEWLYNWSAETEADPDVLADVLTKYDYTISKETSDITGSTYQAVGSDGVSTVTCTRYADKDFAYEAMDKYILTMYKNLKEPSDVPVNELQYSAFLYHTKNCLYVVASPMGAGITSFRGAYLSGSVMIEVDIKYEIDAIRTFVYAMQEFGFGSPLVKTDNSLQNLPDTIQLCSSEEFIEVLEKENIPLAYRNTNPILKAVSEDLNVRVILDDLQNPSYIEQRYIAFAYSGFFDSMEYEEANAYRILTISSSEQGQYGILLKTDDQLLTIIVNWNPGDAEQEAKQRALAENLLKKLCFPDSLT